MKKHVLLYFALIFCAYSYAFQTVLTSSIYVSEETLSYSTPDVTNVAITPRRARFINKITSTPEIQTALSLAENIFSEAMNSEFLEFAPIIAEVTYAGYSELEDDEVCRVEVLYTDTIIYHPFYYNIEQYHHAYYPILIPKAMHNLGNSTTSNSPILQIKLNPNFSYHFDDSPVPPDKCDAITIFLRALAIGCGIHSTFDPETLEFGVTHEGRSYLSAFDSKIYNENGATCEDIVYGNINITDFLAMKSIFAKGYQSVSGHDEIAIQLYNDWEYDFNPNTLISSKTFNTINSNTYTDEEYNNKFYDLLDAFLGEGVQQRTMSPYTMALLRSLGWKKTIPVGNEEAIDNSTLCCSSSILRPNQTYSLWTTDNNMLVDNVVCQLDAVDTLYSIGTGYSSFFWYDSIPDNIQWKRNPITKNIVGQIQCKASKWINSTLVEYDKVCPIEVPYKPNRPLVQRSESTNNGFLTLNLKAFANGSETYTITYTGVTSEDTHTFTIAANALDTILTNITADQLYNMSIYGTNNEGNSETYTFTFGASRPQLNLAVILRTTTLRYSLSSNDTTYIPEIIIELVQITNLQGDVVLTSQAEPGELIDISSLTRGTYILNVIANGKRYSRTFVRR